MKALNLKSLYASKRVIYKDILRSKVLYFKKRRPNLFLTYSVQYLCNNIKKRSYLSDYQINIYMTNVYNSFFITNSLNVLNNDP